MLIRSISFILGALFCLISLQSGAEPRPYNENPFAAKSVCEMNPEDFQAKAGHSGNLTQPQNEPGPLNTGMCWWHSKLQRAAIYLAVFDRPQDPRPTSEEAKQIFKDLSQLKTVVSIPGFTDWFHFTTAFRSEFYEVLGDWEIHETLRLEFVKGLRALKPMDSYQWQQINREVNEYKRVTFLFLKMPDVRTHSWLVNSVTGSIENFQMSFIDSTYSSGLQSYKSQGNEYVITEALHYTRSTNTPNGAISEPSVRYETSKKAYPEANGLVDTGGRSMSLYVQNDNTDFLKITEAIRKHCGGDTAFTLHEKEVRAKKEQRAFDQINWWRPGVPHN